jgi:alcohol dehydrogenase class IV
VTPARWANPVALVFGAGASAALPRELAPLARRALVVTDPGVAAQPAARAVLDLLGGERFTAVEPSPDVGTVRACIAAARECGAEALVGFGGGSVMDVTKVAAAAARAPWLLDLPAGQGHVQPAERGGPAGLPVIQVPTTAATGSELNPVASISAAGTKRLLVHARLYARVAVVDPALHVTLPARQTAEGALETLCRVLVPYLTDTVERPLQDAQTRALVGTLLDATDAVLADGSVAAREALALSTVASVQSLANFGRSRHGHLLWYLGNALTGRGLTKGQALAPLLRVYLHQRPARLAGLEQAVGPLLERVAAWGLPQTLPDLEGPALAAETRALWGDVPGLADLDLEAFYRAAAESP